MNLKKYVNYGLSSLCFCTIFVLDVDARTDGMRKVPNASEMIFVAGNALIDVNERDIGELLEELDTEILSNNKESVESFLAIVPENLIIQSSAFYSYSTIEGDRDNEILDLLLAHCHPENFLNEEYSYDCLIPFVKGNDLESIQKLVQKGANLNAKGGEFGEPLLFFVTNSDIISFFREKNADMNVKNNDGYTALFMWPYWRSYTTTVSFLQNGVDPTIQDVGGKYLFAL